MMLAVDQVVTVKRTFTQDDFNRFAMLSGDDNPIHVDPQFSARTRFGRTVAHGMFLYSVLCAAWSAHLSGAIQLEQELIFPAPTFVGDVMTFRLEVTALNDGEAEMNMQVLRPDGAVTVEGRTRVCLPTSQVRRPAASATKKFSDSAQHYKGLQINQCVLITRTFSRADLAEYVDLTRDSNPVFTGDAATLPGGLLGGLFSFLLGTELPGRGTNWLRQHLAFPAPAYPDETLTASVEIVRIRPEKDLVNLKTLCVNQQNEIVCDGEALVLVKDLETIL